MNVRFDNSVEQEVWQTLRAINDAWTIGNPGDLKNYFHAGMIAMRATEKGELEGRDACLMAWNNFAKATKIQHWKELDPKIRIFGDTAVVTYYFNMRFEIGGRNMNLNGRDLYVFIREGGKWWAVTNQFDVHQPA